jgi:hypothetical protein
MLHGGPLLHTIVACKVIEHFSVIAITQLVHIQLTILCIIWISKVSCIVSFHLIRLLACNDSELLGSPRIGESYWDAMNVTVYRLDGMEARTREYYNDSILR